MSSHIVTRLQAGQPKYRVSIRGKSKKYFLSPKRQEGLWGRSSSPFIWDLWRFTQVVLITHGWSLNSNDSLSSIAEVKNEWSHTSSPFHLLSWREHGNFTSTFTRHNR